MEKNTSEYFVQGAISTDEIAKLYDALSRQQHTGGVATFSGQIRADEIDGKQVTAIEYSAYEPMAVTAFDTIKTAALKQHDVQSITILHSLGAVNVGACCLFVMVASAHRRPSFEALKHVVEAIKADVPIFGKELFADATHVWKENR